MTVIAIDGPSGSGKSTLARALAERLGIARLDTGAMYRAIALLALEQGVEPSDGGSLARLAKEANLRVDDAVFLNGADVTEAIRSARVTSVVSQISSHQSVRDALVARQRTWVAEHVSGVIEGRDIGSVVVPDADVKVYLTADPTERARRRSAELDHLRHNGKAVDIGEVEHEMAGRDASDENRAISPLLVAPGAVVIDSTHRDVEDVVEEVLSLL